MVALYLSARYIYTMCISSVTTKLPLHLIQKMYAVQITAIDN